MGKYALGMGAFKAVWEQSLESGGFFTHSMARISLLSHTHHKVIILTTKPYSCHSLLRLFRTSPTVDRYKKSMARSMFQSQTLFFLFFHLLRGPGRTRRSTLCKEIPVSLGFAFNVIMFFLKNPPPQRNTPKENRDFFLRGTLVFISVLTLYMKSPLSISTMGYLTFFERYFWRDFLKTRKKDEHW